MPVAEEYAAVILLDKGAASGSGCEGVPSVLTGNDEGLQAAVLKVGDGQRSSRPDCRSGSVIVADGAMYTAEPPIEEVV